MQFPACALHEPSVSFVLCAENGRGLRFYMLSPAVNGGRKNLPVAAWTKSFYAIRRGKRQERFWAAGSIPEEYAAQDGASEEFSRNAFGTHSRLEKIQRCDRFKPGCSDVAGSLPDDVRVTKHLTENDNAR